MCKTNESKTIAQVSMREREKNGNLNTISSISHEKPPEYNRAKNPVQFQQKYEKKEKKKTNIPERPQTQEVGISIHKLNQTHSQMAS